MPKRPLLCALLAAAAALLPASAASADTFFVDGSAAAGGDCSQLTPCQTIADAISASRATLAEADTIEVAAGLYEEPIELMNAEDSGLTINGAGSGSDPATNTIVRSGNAGVYFVVVLGDPSGLGASHMTVRDLRVEHNSYYDSENDDYRGAGIIANTPDALIENVHVQIPAPGGHELNIGDPAVSVRAPRATLDHVVARNTGGGAGVYADSEDLVVRDSDIEGGTGGGLEVRSDGHLLLQRSRIAASPDAEYALRTQGTLTADSSLLTGGFAGLLYFGTTGAERVDAVLRGLTIDSGTPGVADPLVLDEGNDDYGGIGVQLQGGGANLDSSIVLERSVTYGGDLRCHFSDVPDQVELPSPANFDGSIACSTAPGNAEGNSSSAPASLFADGPGGDWTLRPDAPARDRGAPAALAAGESATDLAGAARVLDSNRDCLARRDQGAYELTGAANTPPVIGAIGPASAVAGMPFAPVAQLSDAEDPPAALTYVWRFADGAVSSAPPVSHTFTAPIDAGRLEITVKDSGGCTATAGRDFRVFVAPPPPDRFAPVFSSFSLTRKSFAVANRRTPVAAKVARGTVLRWSLSEPAQVRITVQRLVRKRGRLRAVRAGTLRRAAPSGRYRLAFSGRIGRKALKPGRYRLRVIATDKAGNVSRQRRVSFTIVR